MKWCKHVQKSIAVNDDSYYFVEGHWASGMVMSYHQFCPICGTQRPVEKKVECPSKFVVVKQGDYDMSLKVNQILDYLESKPWEKV